MTIVSHAHCPLTSGSRNSHLRFPHHRRLFNPDNMPLQARMHHIKSKRNAGLSYPGQKNAEKLPKESESSCRPQVRTKSRRNSFDFVADIAVRGSDTPSSHSMRAAQLSTATPRPPAKVALSEHPGCSVDFGSEICPEKTRVKEPDAVRAEVIELQNLPVFLYRSAGKLSVPPTARLAGR